MNHYVQYRFSGHETFSCRYTWLPKAVTAIQESPEIFSDEDAAMIELGVGKNMVRAIRFWAEATTVIRKLRTGGWDVTPFGKDLFNQHGFDPFLEDNQTLWLIHWKLSTQFNSPLFAWDYMLNQWHDPEFTKSSALKAFEQEVIYLGGKWSKTTLARHFDTFNHTYLPTRGSKGNILEETLDCPLVELELIQRIGDRPTDETGKRESIYAFRFEAKPEIGPELFIYCLADYFARKHPSESTLTFREIAIGHGSPGQVFKLPEMAIRERLEHLNHQTNGLFVFEESTNIQQVHRQKEVPFQELLKAIYKRESIHA